MKINTNNTLQGETASLINLNLSQGELVISSDVKNNVGNFALFVNKANGTSSYLTDEVLAKQGSSFFSNTWVDLGDNEFFRSKYYSTEGFTGGHSILQKSLDGGITWVDGITYFQSNTLSLFEYGGFYDKLSDIGYVVAVIGVDGQDFKLILNKFSNKMTNYLGYITLNDPVTNGWYRLSQGRPIILQSGSIVFAVTSSSDTFSAMDAPSGIYRCANGLDPSLAENWQYIEGYGSGYTRGIIEPNIVEMSNGNVLLEANTRSGFLVHQTWTDDCTIPGHTVVTNISAPRTKADIIKLENGEYARLWCSTVPVGNYEKPRINAVLAFSKDLVNWEDFHIVAKGNFIYELYLQEINGKLKVRYWDWVDPNLTDLTKELPQDKWFDLKDRQEGITCRTIKADSKCNHVTLYSVLTAYNSCYSNGFRIKQIPKNMSIKIDGQDFTIKLDGVDSGYRLVMPDNKSYWFHTPEGLKIY